ncbi:hypothetical protein [Bacillus sp. JCM 19034]|uniref:hypothetical protein n=1 Tax=Bacillus sp. JCM 19034 TaxID=1481928 RepID=UPI000781B462|nr:hypothetical protein [Bacillus sp. JCM 19034]
MIGKQSEVKSEPPVEKAELDEFVLLNKEDDFEETVIEIDNISDKGVDYSERQDQLINLADYDFSDISSADGIPVEGILEKIGLGN